MTKKYLILFIICFIFIYSGCSNDDNTNPVTPNTGEVLLATVSGDSVGTPGGFSGKSITITSGTLNFTDRDSARLSFYYSGENNNNADPFKIYYTTIDSTDVLLYTGNTLTITSAEQYLNITVPSPRINLTFRYTIKTSSSPGFSYFKFRDLKIYKK
ncbi:MAG: hypothetical protein LH629_08750 [Ignavibacteria bacterium]|nr:hypothetical protein [Ignavibacteria bacterium]